LADPVDALILDLLGWIGPKPRAYSEVIEAWRTSCPRLPVWEESQCAGFHRTAAPIGYRSDGLGERLGKGVSWQASFRANGLDLRNPDWTDRDVAPAPFSSSGAAAGARLAGRLTPRP
jgi:hypothetical protein